MIVQVPFGVTSGDHWKPGLGKAKMLLAGSIPSMDHV